MNLKISTLLLLLAFLNIQQVISDDKNIKHEVKRSLIDAFSSNPIFRNVFNRRNEDSSFLDRFLQHSYDKKYLHNGPYLYYYPGTVTIPDKPITYDLDYLIPNIEGKTTDTPGFAPPINEQVTKDVVIEDNETFKEIPKNFDAFTSPAIIERVTEVVFHNKDNFNKVIKVVEVTPPPLDIREYQEEVHTDPKFYLDKIFTKPEDSIKTSEDHHGIILTLEAPTQSEKVDNNPPKDQIKIQLIHNPNEPPEDFSSFEELLNHTLSLPIISRNQLETDNSKKYEPNTLSYHKNDNSINDIEYLSKPDPGNPPAPLENQPNLLLINDWLEMSKMVYNRLNPEEKRKIYEANKAIVNKGKFNEDNDDSVEFKLLKDQFLVTEQGKKQHPKKYTQPHPMRLDSQRFPTEYTITSDSTSTKTNPNSSSVRTEHTQASIGGNIYPDSDSGTPTNGETKLEEFIHRTNLPWKSESYVFDDDINPPSVTPILHTSDDSKTQNPPKQNELSKLFTSATTKNGLLNIEKKNDELIKALDNFNRSHNYKNGSINNSTVYLRQDAESDQNNDLNIGEIDTTVGANAAEAGKDLNIGEIDTKVVENTAEASMGLDKEETAITKLSVGEESDYKGLNTGQIDTKYSKNNAEAGKDLDKEKTNKEPTTKPPVLVGEVSDQNKDLNIGKIDNKDLDKEKTDKKLRIKPSVSVSDARKVLNKFILSLRPSPRSSTFLSSEKTAPVKSSKTKFSNFRPDFSNVLTQIFGQGALALKNLRM